MLRNGLRQARTIAAVNSKHNNYYISWEENKEMNKKVALTLAGLGLALAAAGCETTTTTNSNTAVRTANSNTAVVVNNNAVDTTTTNTTTTTTKKEMTRADFDKEKERYAEEAKKGGRKVGTGANDLWLWTKTRAALATTDDLRDSTINVDVDNEVVTLIGTVGTADQKAKAEMSAKGIEGVKKVVNNLKVAPADSMTNMNGNANMKHDNMNMKKK